MISATVNYRKRKSWCTEFSRVNQHRYFNKKWWCTGQTFFEKIRDTEKTRADTNSRLNNFCKEKNIKLLSNDNFKEEHLGVKKLHLNMKGNSIFAKNLLQFIEADWDFSPLGDSYIEMENVRNTSTTIVSNAVSTLQDNSW